MDYMQVDWMVTPLTCTPTFSPAGDDDTLFFMPNVLSLLGRLDHRIPMALTENLWWVSRGRSTDLTCLSAPLSHHGITNNPTFNLYPCPHFRYNIRSERRTHNGHPHPAAPRCASCAATGTLGLESEGSLGQLAGGEVRRTCVISAFCLRHMLHARGLCFTASASRPPESIISAFRLRPLVFRLMLMNYLVLLCRCTMYRLECAASVTQSRHAARTFPPGWSARHPALTEGA